MSKANLSNLAKDLIKLIEEQGSWEDEAQHLKRVSESANEIANVARSKSVDKFDLGEITWASPLTIAWMRGLLRFRTVKFIGLLRGRVFIGAMWGDKFAPGLPEYELCKAKKEGGNE